MLPCGTSFSGVFDKILIKIPRFYKPYARLALKIFYLCTFTQALFFWQNILFFSTQFFQVYVDIFNHIERYWSTFHASWDINKAYWAPCVTLAYSQPCHILSSGIFRTKGLFKTLWNVDQAYSEPCHRALFRHIQTSSQPCAKLAYAETWYTRNSRIFRTFL